MFSTDQLNSMVRDLLAQFYGNNQGNQSSNCNTNQNSMNQAGTHQTGGGSNKLSLEPSQALIIAGLLGGCLK